MAFTRVPSYDTPLIEEGVWTRSEMGKTLPVYNAHTTPLPFRFVKYNPNAVTQQFGSIPGVLPITADEPDLIAGILMRPSAGKVGTYKTINGATVSWQTASGFSAVPVNYVSSIAYEGFLNVFFEQDCSFDDTLFMRFAANGANTELGRVRADANSASCLELPAGKVTLVKPVKAGSFGEIRINF